MRVYEKKSQVPLSIKKKVVQKISNKYFLDMRYLGKLKFEKLQDFEKRKFFFFSRIERETEF